MNGELPGPTDINVPEGRDRLGRAHQMRVDISVAISLAPAWLRRALGDKDVAKARSARIEFVERIALAIETRFRVTWLGTDDDAQNARPQDRSSPLFGGPETGRSDADGRVDGPCQKKHNVNMETDRVGGGL